MPQITASRYRTDANHWHRPGREKRCIMCGEQKGLAEFYQCAYTAANGRRSLRYESRCRPCARLRRRRQTIDHPGRNAALSRSWKERNPEAHKALSERWRRSERGRRLKAQAQRLRKARMRSGAKDDPEIRAIYAQAMHEEQLIKRCPVFDLPELGKKLHVDHRIPLAKGGKHVAGNLQILAGGLNMRKGTRCPE